MKREDRYKRERGEMINEIIKRLEIDKNRKKGREELETEEIKEYVLSRMEEIKKYYSTSRWRSVYRDDNKELNILKNIMREHGINIIKTEKKKKTEEGKYEGHRVYIFEIPEEIKIK